MHYRIFFHSILLNMLLSPLCLCAEKAVEQTQPLEKPVQQEPVSIMALLGQSTLPEEARKIQPLQKGKSYTLRQLQDYMKEKDPEKTFFVLTQGKSKTLDQTNIKLKRIKKTKRFVLKEDEKQIAAEDEKQIKNIKTIVTQQ